MPVNSGCAAHHRSIRVLALVTAEAFTACDVDHSPGALSDIAVQEGGA